MVCTDIVLFSHLVVGQPADEAPTTLRIHSWCRMVPWSAAKSFVTAHGPIFSVLQTHLRQDKHTCNAWGFTGLHFAASKFRVDVAKVLCEAGHDINIQDCNGSTPLDYCFNSGVKGDAGTKEYIAMCEFLESRGALRSHEMCWLNAHNQEGFAPVAVTA